MEATKNEHFAWNISDMILTDWIVNNRILSLAVEGGWMFVWGLNNSLFTASIFD